MVPSLAPPAEGQPPSQQPQPQPQPTQQQSQPAPPPPPPLQLPSLKDWDIPPPLAPSNQQSQQPHVQEHHHQQHHVASSEHHRPHDQAEPHANAFLPGPDGTPAVKEEDVAVPKREPQPVADVESHYPYALGGAAAPSYATQTSYSNAYTLPGQQNGGHYSQRPTPPPSSYGYHQAPPPPQQQQQQPPQQQQQQPQHQRYAPPPIQLPSLSQPQSPQPQYRATGYPPAGNGGGSGHQTPSYGYEVAHDGRSWSTGYGTPVDGGQHAGGKRERSWDGETGEYVEGGEADQGADKKRKGNEGGDLSVTSGGKPAPVKKFVCPHASCGRAFARNFNLQSHIKSHLGVRDFNCPECPKAFSHRHDCARHCIAVHHYDKETGKPKVAPGVVGGPQSGGGLGSSGAGMGVGMMSAAHHEQQQQVQQQSAQHVQQQLGQMAGLDGSWSVDEAVGSLGLPGLDS